MTHQPATKLLDFFRGTAAGEAHAIQTGKVHLVEAGGHPIYDTRRIQQLSPSLRKLSILDGAYAKAWISYWKRIGYLPNLFQV